MKSGDSSEEPKMLTMNILTQLLTIASQSIYFLFSQDTLLLCCNGYEIKQIMLNCVPNGRSITLTIKMLIITD